MNKRTRNDHDDDDILQAYQWSRPIPASLKVIHSRVYAQAITLGALGAMAGLETYHRTLHPSGSSREEDAY